MRFLFLVSIIFFTLGTTLNAQSNPCACCTEAHQQFDFWVGDWVVSDTLGNVVGENTVVKLEQDCILNEHWRGASGTTGRSYNYYNRADSTWNQLWIDNSGSNLVLKGRGETNKMILKSELTKGQQIDWYYNQITWTKNEDGSVTQLWEALDKNNKPLAILFKGIYKKKE